MSYFRELFLKLRRSWIWVVLQFLLTLVLIVAGLAWTRIPEKHWWQVLLTLVVPLLLLVSIVPIWRG